MEEQFRLVFRGEVAEGQHAAVVKQRLATLLRLDAEKVESLFGGSAVVLRRSVDRATAAQFQAAFKKAGAKLRVQPIRYEGEGEEPAPATPAAAAEPITNEASTKPASEVGLRLLPVGSFILEVHERLPPVEANVPISHLQLDELSALESTATDAEAAAPVNVDHLSVADVGAQIGSEDTEAVEVPDFVVTFELAEDGSWLQAEGEDAVVVIDAPDYSLAEPGAVLAPAKTAAEDAVPPPDVSHLSLKDDEPDR